VHSREAIHISNHFPLPRRSSDRGGQPERVANDFLRIDAGLGGGAPDRLLASRCFRLGGWLRRGARHSSAAVWAPIVAAVALAPGVYDQLLTLYADIPLAIFLCIGLLLLGLWLADDGTRHLVLGALFLAVAANTKNEGLMAGAVSLAALASVVVVRPPPGVTRLRAVAPVAAALAGVVAAVLPGRPSGSRRTRSAETFL